MLETVPEMQKRIGLFQIGPLLLQISVPRT